MKLLSIEESEYTPSIVLDPDENKFVISGESRPEDAREFYEPILAWFEEYYALRYWKDSNFEHRDVIAVFEFKFQYLNSTSAKFVLDILKKIEKFQEDNMALNVKWYYDELDEDMKESGEMFESMVNFSFEFIAMPV